MHTHIRICIHACTIHTDIHLYTYFHTHKYTYIHRYIHTYKCGSGSIARGRPRGHDCHDEAQPAPHAEPGVHQHVSVWLFFTQCACQAKQNNLDTNMHVCYAQSHASHASVIATKHLAQECTHADTHAQHLPRILMETLCHDRATTFVGIAGVCASCNMCVDETKLHVRPSIRRACMWYSFLSTHSAHKSRNLFVYGPLHMTLLMLWPLCVWSF